MSTETLAAPTPAKAPPKRSGVEEVKESSRQLRGSIALTLVSDTDHFSEADRNVLKFHGTYQQEDRDARKNRNKAGVGKHFMFMVRCKIPGGRVTAAQYLAVDDLAGKYANGTLRFTTRQGIQLHGVLKSHLKDTIAGINHCLLTTLGACGDVERNVMACPAPHHDGVHAQLQETARVLAAHLAPRTRAYHEIWLNGQPLEDPAAQTDVEPLYGKTYLPRKFKTGLALPEDNCIDVYAQDLGLLAIVEGGQIIGYNVLVGGGMGMSHGNANTFPFLAKPICYVPTGAVVNAAEAVVRLFRDHGNRADRKRARIKYLVHDWGVEKFREVLAGYLGAMPELPRPVEVSGFETHLGWHPQGNGKWYYGLSIENGRVKDEGTFRLRTALRTLVERLQPEIRITPLQDVLLCDLEESARAEIERTLAEHGVSRPDQVSTVRRYSMACPAVPTCGLAISESERVLPGLIDQLEVELKRLGLEEEKLTVRMTGCPNGCARPYQSDIGLVGRSGDKYTVYVGGHLLGHRLSFVLKDLVPLAEVVPTLAPVLEQFRRDRRPSESFGDYCHRQGAEQLSALLPQSATPARGGHAAPAARVAGIKETPTETNGAHAKEATPARPVNGDVARPASLPSPEVRAVAVPVPEVTAAAVEAALPPRRSETVLAGRAGEERPDYTLHFHSDGSVRETVVYFYSGDRRASEALPGDALVREAAYPGRVDPYRLHAARKLSDLHYIGPTGWERRDRRVEYHPNGQVARTVIYHYEGDARAVDAPTGAALRREVTYEGPVG